MHETEIRRSIRSLEKYQFGRRFPEELEEYFYETYGKDRRLQEFTREDIYGGIKADAAAYFAGKPEVPAATSVWEEKRELLRPPQNDPQNRVAFPDMP